MLSIFRGPGTEGHPGMGGSSLPNIGLHPGLHPGRGHAPSGVGQVMRAGAYQVTDLPHPGAGPDASNKLGVLHSE